MARPKGIPAHNKGKTNLELYGPEKAAELSKRAAENSRRTKNRLGTTTTEEGRRNISRGKLGTTTSRRGKTTVEFYGAERSAEINKKRAIKLKANWKAFREEHPPEDRNTAQYNEWQDKVKLKFGNTCQRCGVKEEELPKTGWAYERFLHCHHIKDWATYPNLRYDVDNGLLLCDSCHKDEHSKLRERTCHEQIYN